MIFLDGAADGVSTARRWHRFYMWCRIPDNFPRCRYFGVFTTGRASTVYEVYIIMFT